MQLLDLKLGLTATFHPAADGRSELTNAMVEIALRCFLAGDVERYLTWPDYLPIVNMS
jgi:hypothetical protein